jgi:DSF synthase
MAIVAQAAPHHPFINSVFTNTALAEPPERLPARDPGIPTFENLTVRIEPRSRTYWCYMRPRERPSFTPALLADLAEMQRSLKLMFASGEAPIHYYVLGSQLPGIFNLGGDLSVLAERIRERDRSSLVHYARACIDVLYQNAVSFDLPVVTVALVQGDALGGGFEAALSCDVIVAERGARFGLPEVLFNLFPGMGAYSFLARRLGAAQAEKMILSGRIYTAEELYDMGVVQALAEPGMGEQAVREYIDRNARRHNAQAAVYRAGRRVWPVSYDELKDITDLWVEAALNLRESDLRKMMRLTAAQNRRWSGRMISAAE